MKCTNCQAELSPVGNSANGPVLNICRICKLPHDASGVRIFDSRTLQSQFDPLKAARRMTNAVHPDAAPATKNALEVGLIQGFQEFYFLGLKEGVMLAYSLDVKEKPMEKLGVDKQELVTELQGEFAKLQNKINSLDKLGSAGTEQHAEVVKQATEVKKKIDELGKNG